MRALVLVDRGDEASGRTFRVLVNWRPLLGVTWDETMDDGFTVILFLPLVSLSWWRART